MEKIKKLETRIAEKKRDKERCKRETDRQTERGINIEQQE
jgi:hypothetical protein